MTEQTGRWCSPSAPLRCSRLLQDPARARPSLGGSVIWLPCFVAHRRSLIVSKVEPSLPCGPCSEKDADGEGNGVEMQVPIDAVLANDPKRPGAIDDDRRARDRKHLPAGRRGICWSPKWLLTRRVLASSSFLSAKRHRGAARAILKVRGASPSAGQALSLSRSAARGVDAVCSIRSARPAMAKKGLSRLKAARQLGHSLQAALHADLPTVGRRATDDRSDPNR